MNIKKRINLGFLVSICSILFLSSTDVFAKYTLLEKIPGVTGSEFPSYIQGLYKFALGFVVIGALLMITIGGFYYITSAGNQAQAGSAKKIVTDALLGLIIVFVTWLILNTINPDLLNIGSTGLSELQSGLKK